MKLLMTGMNPIRHSMVLAAIVAMCLLTACNSLRAPGPYPQPGPGTAIPPGTPQPTPGQPQPGEPAPKQFRLGPAASALVSQAHTQANGGNFGLAAATVERALRIEPDNPLLWIELGQVRMAEGNADQADGMNRKALALATGDSQAQETAWRLIAE